MYSQLYINVDHGLVDPKAQRKSCLKNEVRDLVTHYVETSRVFVNNQRIYDYINGCTTQQSVYVFGIEKVTIIKALDIIKSHFRLLWFVLLNGLCDFQTRRTFCWKWFRYIPCTYKTSLIVKFHTS